MDVSIVIINYNTFELTSQCIASVIEHTHGLEYEIILVDNASNEIPARGFLKRFPSIKLVENATNAGFAEGNNNGLERAEGQYILLLNSDVLIQDEVVVKTFDFIRNANGVGIVTCQLIYPEGRIQHNCQRFPSITKSLFELFRLQKLLPGNTGGRILLGPFFKYDEVVYPDWVWGTFFMFPKSLLERFPDKRLPATFFMYGEDMQWCMEIRRLGYRVAFYPYSKVVHLLGKSGGNREMIKKNHEIFMKLYYRPWQISTISWLNKLLTFRPGI
jgi:GT2 family glycosyltransferase